MFPGLDGKPLQRAIDALLARLKTAYASSIGSSLMGYIAPFTDAIATTVNLKLGERVTPQDFMTSAQKMNVFLRLGTLDVSNAIQKALNSANFYLPDGVYRTTVQLLVPAGREFEFGPGATVIYDGAALPTYESIFKFVTGASGIRVHRPDVINNSSNKSIFAFRGRAVDDVVIYAAVSQRCAVALFDSSSDTYAGVITDVSNPGFNCSRNVHVHGYTCFGDPSDLTRLVVPNAVSFFYCLDYSASGGYASDCFSMFNAWGGDASPSTDGAVGNERKCVNGVISGSTSIRTHAGPWVSMGRGVAISGNGVRDCLDVGVDFEGSEDCNAVGNNVSEARNGNLTTFALNKNVSFTANASLQSTATAPHGRIYNVSQDGMLNVGVSFTKNTFRTTGGVIGVFDDTFGPANDLTFSDNELWNTKVFLIALNKDRTHVERNNLHFDVGASAPFAGITVWNSRKDGRISGNSVDTLVNQPAQSLGLDINNADTNYNADYKVDDNYTRGFDGDARFGCSSANTGIYAQYQVHRNTFSSAKVLYQSPLRVIFDWRFNKAATFVNLPNGPDTTRFWPANTHAEPDAPAIGSPSGWVVVTPGLPATWGSKGNLS